MQNNTLSPSSQEASPSMNYLTLTSIQAGIYICTSAIMAGHILLTNIGLKGAVIGIILGSLILWALGLIFAKLAVLSKEVLIELVMNYFGKRVAQICGLSFAISLMGWFAVQLELMSHSIHFIYPSLSIGLCNLFLGSLIILNVVKGINWIGRFADLSVPLIIGVMGYTLFLIYDPLLPMPDSEISFSGIFMVIAFSIAGVIDTPTYFAKSKSKQDAYIAITLVYLILLPFLAFMGLALALYTGVDDFTQALMLLGGKFWQFFVMLFIVLSGWTTNNGNLYSAAVAISPCWQTSPNRRTCLLGVSGIALASLGVIHRFYDLLDIMSIAVACVGAALMGRFIMNHLRYQPLQKKEHKIYTLIILVAACIGFLSCMKLIHLSSFAFMNSLLVALILIVFHEGAKKCLAKSI